jgi:hypothetical protein
VRSHPTAGQATLEYIAAVALLAALFLVAAPAVGAPTSARGVADAFRHGLCVVGGDICGQGDARRAGLPPCPLKSDLTGAEGSVTAFSVELGGKWTLTVTPRSDGSVAVTRTGGGSAGFAGATKLGGSAGPVRFEGGGEGAIRVRVQAARGWVFRDAAAAKRFLEHATRHSFDDDRWPPAWQSGEVGGEGSGSLVVSAGDQGGDSGQVGGTSLGAGTAIGWRRFKDGSTTRYARFNVDGAEINVASLPSPWEAGKAEWISEYTRGPHGEPREIVLRTARMGSDNRLTESIAHLDLTDPPATPSRARSSARRCRARSRSAPRVRRSWSGSPRTASSSSSTPRSRTTRAAWRSMSGRSSSSASAASTSRSTARSSRRPSSAELSSESGSIA